MRRRLSLPSVSAVTVFALCVTCTDAAASDLDMLLFGSLDVGARGFTSFGAKMAAGSLATSGLVALVTAGGGLRSARFTCGCGRNYTLTGFSLTTSGLVGYQWIWNGGSVAVYLGDETAADKFGPVAAITRTGVRLQAEAWLRPTEATLIQATLIAGTARIDAWARFAWGYRLWGAYVGPEGSAYADATGYRKLAGGAHVTDLALADVRFRVSTGLQWETDRRAPSPYFALSAWVPL